jgi:hypothetical protein
MVDIHSIAASSHPSHREQETEREVTFSSRAGRSRRASAMTVVIATQQQHTAGTVQTPPSAVGVEATLVAARRLLNNSPSMHASPSSTEQWHHDADQLIVAAINTLHHEGGWQELMVAHSRSPSVARAPPSVGVPHQMRVLPSITMVDLRDELICRRRGEDSRITIERHRERHRERRLRCVLCIPLALQ